jgi:transcription termination factor Rho
VTAQALEQSVLESKDKTQLIQIAEALGVKASARNKKAEIIDQILSKTANGEPTPAPAPAPAPASRQRATPSAPDAGRATTPSDPIMIGLPDAEPKAAWETGLDQSPAAADAAVSKAPATASEPATQSNGASTGGDTKIDESGPTGGSAPKIPENRNVGGDSSPARTDGRPENRNEGNRNRNNNNNNNNRNNSNQNPNQNQNQNQNDGEGGDRSKRRRRRRKGGGTRQDGPQGDDRELIEDYVEPTVSTEPVKVEGYLDMRDEGYGFLRIDNFLASSTDSYVPVKLARQFGLRKGDHVAGISRPAGRNEKNPALLEIESINGRPPEEAKNRPRFEDLTALFPDSMLKMENESEPTNMTARIIDLVCPIGKGQRGIIVSPPKAGKTTVMKSIVASVEKNNPECKVMVLLIDERPEEVTDMKRMVKGEVIASTFDRPSDEHTQIAEIAIEKAKRMVEYGEDVVVVLDGITRLSRAYNLAAPASGRILSGGIDAGALYPPKRFFGAARNVEEGGSLTILATALVETNSRMDEAVFEEFKGTGNMELRLDRKLAERRIYPAIDVDASSTRHEELLFDRKQLQTVWKLRRVLSGLAADGNAAPGLELLVDRLRTFRNNAEFLDEISKQPGM